MTIHDAFNASDQRPVVLRTNEAERPEILPLREWAHDPTAMPLLTRRKQGWSFAVGRLQVIVRARHGILLTGWARGYVRVFASGENSDPVAWCRYWRMPRLEVRWWSGRYEWLVHGFVTPVTPAGAR